MKERGERARERGERFEREMRSDRIEAVGPTAIGGKFVHLFDGFFHTTFLISFPLVTPKT